MKTEISSNTRVYWTDQEQESVSMRVAELMHREGLTIVPGAGRSLAGDRYFRLVKQAQDDALPSDRRRFLAARQNIPDGMAGQVRLQLDLLMRAAGRQAAVEVATPAAPRREVAEAQPLAEPARVVVNVQQGKTPLAEFKDDELAIEFFKRMLSKTADLARVAEKVDAMTTRLDALTAKLDGLSQYDDMVTDEMSALARKVSELQTSAKVTAGAEVENPVEPGKSFRVAVVGFLKSQFEQLKRRVEHLGIELQFVDQDKHPHRITSVDFVVYTRFISHKWTDCNNAHLDRSQWVHTRGGIGQTAELIVAAEKAFDKTRIQ